MQARGRARRAQRAKARAREVRGPSVRWIPRTPATKVGITMHVGRKLVPDISAPANVQSAGNQTAQNAQPASGQLALPPPALDALELRSLELPSERSIEARCRSVLGLAFGSQALYITKQILETIAVRPMPPQHAPERLSPPGDDTPERLRPSERNTSERHQPPRQEAPERVGPPGTELLSPPGAERLSPPAPILSERPESPDDSAFEYFLNLESKPNDEYELI